MRLRPIRRNFLKPVGRAVLGGVRNPLLGLFTAGENGFLFYADASYLATSTDGTGPVVADDPIAYIKDISPNLNHGTQATLGQRPLWKPASASYAMLDGVDDRLQTVFVPGSAITLASACRMNTNANTFVMGGGFNTTNARCGLGLGSTGNIGGQWKGQNQGTIAVGSDIRGADHVIALNADLTTVELWLDGVKVYSQPAVGSGTGGGALCVGGLNNNGTFSGAMAGNTYVALSRSVKSTDAEMALIYNQLRRSYP